MSTEEEEIRFYLWLHRPTNAIYIVDIKKMLAAGPIADDKALAELKKAREWVADYCELGPKTWGFNHLRPVPLPFPEQEWVTLEESWLPGGVAPSKK